MARRSPETLVDWLVVGIAPFLIMLLVGSLVFYLVEVFYLGDYQARLLFVMAMFVMAVVCIARISMEEGAAYASLYGLPLAGVVALALATFVEVRGPLAVFGPTLNWMLMAVIWWSSHKLTWDCTLIEGGRDFTGQGLMQTTGLDRFFFPKAAALPTEPEKKEASPPVPDLSGTSTARPTNLPSWEWWKWGGDGRPHAPGVWVVYFSLASLPLFGFGQWFIPADNLELRRRAFWLLVTYVAAGLALLLSTSFLSLRRYLRERKLEMPLEMAGVWLGTGGIMVVAILILASLLPRPIPEYSITHLAPDIKAPKLDASRWGWGKEGAKSKRDAAHTATKGEPATNPNSSSPDGKGSPQQGDKGSPGKQGPPSKSGSQGQSSSGNSSGQGNSKSESENQNSSQQGSKQQNSGQQNSNGSQSSEPSKSQQNGSQQSPNSANSQQSSQQKPDSQGKGNSSKSDPQKPSSPGEGKQQGKQSPDSQNQSSRQNDASKQTNDASQNQQSEPSAEQAPPQPPPTPTRESISNAIGQFFAYFTHLLKWIFYLLVAAVVIYFAWRNRERLLAAWAQLLKELRDLWARLFGGRTSSDATPLPAIIAPPPKRFADFADPFSSGMAARWSLAELVRYTFEALEARGRERACPRQVDQTPLEYAVAVGQTEPALAGEIRWLADLYGQLAFAGGGTSPQAAGQLRQLWLRWKTG